MLKIVSCVRRIAQNLSTKVRREKAGSAANLHLIRSKYGLRKYGSLGHFELVSTLLLACITAGNIFDEHSWLWMEQCRREE